MKSFLHALGSYKKRWGVLLVSFLVALLLSIILGSYIQYSYFPLASTPASLHGTASKPGGSTNAFNPIPHENSLPGTTSWLWTNPVTFDPLTYRFPDIEGYAFSASATPGSTIAFAVSTESKTFTADIYRLGWYQGKGARLLKTVPDIPGHFYPVASPDARTGLVDARWPVSFHLAVNLAWVTGIYLVKLTAVNGKQGYIPFVVTSLRKSAFIFIHASNTDQAYNSWGGKSLYEFNSTNQIRAYKVSYNRPLADDGLPGYGYLFYWEYPMIHWLEQGGYDVQYISSLDSQTDSQILNNHEGILIVGHNEYWSKEMRDHLEQAVRQGVSLANFAADSFFWQIRYEPAADGTANRTIVCYKDIQLDPLAGVDNAHVTVEFRDPPLNRPEQLLLGSMSRSYFDGSGFPWVVHDGSSWVLKGTGLKQGDSLRGLVGYEYDSIDTTFPLPPGVQEVSASPVINIYGKHEYATSTVYTAKSGAVVFNAGTLQWSWGLDDFGSKLEGYGSVVNPLAQKITANILLKFLITIPSMSIRIAANRRMIQSAEMLIEVSS